MTVYVDELPKKCCDCPCCNIDLDCGDCCSLGAFDCDDDFCIKNKHKDCPSQSIADHEKQVRKQVCDEIRKEFEKHTFCWYEDEENGNKDLFIDIDWVWEVLDQIEKGE